MTSSVTTSFNEVILQEFKNDLDSAGSNYYIGLARPTELTLTEDFNSRYFQDQFRHRLQSIKSLSNSSFVIDRVNWTNTATYAAYDTSTNENYHVMNSLNEVFLCVQTGKEEDGRIKPATDEPTRAKAQTFDPSSLSSRTFRTDDDYLWRYLYTLSNLAVSNFLTTDFLPVKRVGATGDTLLSIPQENLQKIVQDSARDGEIIGLAIDSGGTGYTSIPTITIAGNGSSASFSCEVTGGKITRVTVDSDGLPNSGLFLHGSGYDYASVSLSSGDAVLRPIIGPSGGINKEPLRTLNASALMLQADFQGDEFDTILAENDFHQVGIIKNVETTSASLYTGDTGQIMKNLDVTVTTGTQFTEDELIQNGGQTAKGYVFFHDTTAGKLYYWQDETTGFTTFASALPADNQISAVAGGSGTTATFVSDNAPTIDQYSGQVLYINNVGAEGALTPTSGITREADQTEDIRIVIQLG